MNDSDNEETTNHTQQFSNLNNESRIQTKKKEDLKSKKNFCKWCNTETDHKTWRSVNCVAYPNYLRSKLNNKQDKEERNIHLPKEKEKEGTNMLISCDDGGGGSAVAVDITDDNVIASPAVTTIKKYSNG